jgi:quercetin dioxygenase-like cupin family protein
MKHARLSDMTGGWFIGDFAPALIASRDVEVAVKHYRAGDREPEHHHRLATETTAIISGAVTMAGRRWEAGDLILLEPGEATAFEALTDAVTVVVKRPSIPGDKYPGAAPKA